MVAAWTGVICVNPSASTAASVDGRSGGLTACGFVCETDGPFVSLHHHPFDSIPSIGYAPQRRAWDPPPRLWLRALQQPPSPWLPGWLVCVCVAIACLVSKWLVISEPQWIPSILAHRDSAADAGLGFFRPLCSLHHLSLSPSLLELLLALQPLS